MMFLERSRLFRPLVVCAVLVATSVGAVGSASASSTSSSQDTKIDVVVFNVLAPIWAAPEWYPADMDPSLLDTGFRRPLIEDFLRSHADTAEVFALQEVQASEYPHFAAALGDDFVGFMAENDRDFWSNWLTEGLPWQPNGTAVFLRKDAFGTPRFADLDQTSGNSIALATARHLASGQRVRVASVHLDSDSQTNRNTEMRALLAEWGPAGPATTDIIGGDINEDTIHGSLSRMLKQSGFTDVLASLGNREQTHPWLDSYYMSNKWGILDHVLVRNAVPISGDVVDFGVWKIDEETARIEANFEASGSDHFPVVASIRPKS